jgi:hypothetical protein
MRLFAFLLAIVGSALLCDCSDKDCSLSGTCAAPNNPSEAGSPTNDGGDASVATDASNDSTAPPIPGEPLDPKTLPLTGWWRASYSGIPWPQNESAGTSATNDGWTSTAAPIAGTAQNALVPATFNGSNTLQIGMPGRYITPNAWSFVVLAKVIRAEPLGAFPPNDCGFLHEATGTVGVSFGTNAGVPILQAYAFDGAKKSVDITGTSWVHGSYVLVQVKHTGTELRGRVNGDAWKSVAVGALTPLGTIMSVGASYTLTAPFLDGSILEMMTADTALADVTFDGLRAYASGRYKLTL